jgi:hypothetical protein
MYNSIACSHSLFIFSRRTHTQYFSLENIFACSLLSSPSFFFLSFFLPSFLSFFIPFIHSFILSFFLSFLSSFILSFFPSSLPSFFLSLSLFLSPSLYLSLSFFISKSFVCPLINSHNNQKIWRTKRPLKDILSSSSLQFK